MRSSAMLVVSCLTVGCTRAEPGDAQREAEPAATEVAAPPQQATAPAKAQPEQAQPEQAQPEPAPVADEQRAPEPAPEPAPEAAPPPPVQFWVANDGLAAYDLDGKQTAKLGKAPVDDARRLADGRIVGLDDDADPLALVILEANGKVQRRVAIPDRFDPQTCKFGKSGDDPSSWPDELRIQSSHDFALGSTAACLTLQDRNDNMVSYRVELIVDLATGGVTGSITTDINHSCEGQDFSEGTVHASCGPNPSSGQPWIEHTVAPPRAKTTWGYDFDETSLALTKRGKPQAVLCEDGAEPEPYSPLCASVESRSPSGRWILLSGRQSDGDYIHRELVLLDRSTGVLLQVDETYQKPVRLFEIAPEHLFLSGGDVEPLTMVGESDVGWLPEDRLWVDGRLLIPERREIVSIPGNRVRTL